MGGDGQTQEHSLSGAFIGGGAVGFRLGLERGPHGL